MIEIGTIKEEDNYSFSTVVTYPKTTQISHGVYDNKIDMMNMVTMIKTNIASKKEVGPCNVVGRRTKWNFFNDKPEFHRFLDYIKKKNEITNRFFSKNNWDVSTLKIEAWGNELMEGNYVKLHKHSSYHVILYLTEGNPLIIPELKITIKPQVGSYYIFEPSILHKVPEVTDDSSRYNLIVNIEKVGDAHDYYT
tara:strand:+ start:1220 stop:1801 length:582 start_codon:yes stop_codon:yes gene_type:complete